MSLITPDFGLLIWMTLIFGIVFFLLAKFGFPMITGMVDERNKRINDAVAKADEAEKVFAELSVKQAEMIEQTRLQQAQILKEAAEIRDKIISDAKSQASDEAEKLVAAAKIRIDAERESAIHELRRNVALLSVEVAEKVLRKKLEATEEQTALLEKLVEEDAKNIMN